MSTSDPEAPSPTDGIDDARRPMAEAAVALLRSSGVVGGSCRPVGLRTLAGGFSRRAYVLAAEEDGVTTDYVVRVKPRGALLDSDLRQEYDTYALLATTSLPVPRALALDAALETAFDGPYFVMEFASGDAPNVWRRGDREALEADWAGERTVARDLVEVLAGIHAVDAATVARSLPSVGFLERVDHWAGIQREMQVVRDPVIDAAYAWLADREPDPVPPALVHADFRIGNLLLADGRIRAVLDWELAYCGDPRFDLGYVSLDYMSGALMRPGSPLLGGVADRTWFLAEYERLTGRSVDPEVVRTFAVLGALSLIAIFLTGLRLYLDGKTRDVRMLWGRYPVMTLRRELATLMGW